MNQTFVFFKPEKEKQKILQELKTVVHNYFIFIIRVRFIQIR
jgi:hypothetical protein